MMLLPYTVTALAQNDEINGSNTIPNSIISITDFDGEPQLMFDSPDDEGGSLTKSTLENGQRVIYVEPGVYFLTVNNNVTAFAIGSPTTTQGMPAPVAGLEAIEIDIADISSDIDSLLIDGIRDVLDRSRTKIALARQTATNERTEEAIDALELSVNDPNEGLGASFTRLNEVFTTIDGIATSISQINLNATNEAQRLDASLERIDVVETSINGITQAASLLSIRVDNQDTAQASAIDRISQVEIDADDNASAIEAVLGLIENPTDGLAVSFALAQEANIAANGAQSSITAIQNDVTNLNAELSATTNIATQARSTASSNVSAIIGLQSRVSNAAQEASASLALAADLNSELGSIRAVALLTAQADGTLAFVEIAADTNVSQIRFGAGQVIFDNTAGDPAIFLNTDTGNYQFSGTGMFNNGLYSTFNNAYLEVGLDSAGGNLAAATLGYSIPNHLSVVRVNETGVRISGSSSNGSVSDVNINGRTRFSDEVTFAGVTVFGGLIAGTGSNGGTVSVQGDMFINQDLDVNGTITNLSAGHHVLLPKSFVAEVGDLIKLDSLMYQSISRNLGYGSICDEGRAWGVYTDKFKDFDGTYDLHILQSIGEGQINVTNENGDIQKDDLLILSSTPGKAMRQSDDLIRSSTIACAVESHTFSPDQSTALISCIYHIG